MYPFPPLLPVDAILKLCVTNLHQCRKCVSGNTKITMRTNMVSNIVNVFGNWVLIGGNLGFPALGIRGTALATVFGSLVASVMSILSIIGKDTFISIPFMIKEKIRPAWNAFKQIINVGYSIFFEQLLMRIGFMATSLAYRFYGYFPYGCQPRDGRHGSSSGFHEPYGPYHFYHTCICVSARWKSLIWSFLSRRTTHR